MKILNLQNKIWRLLGKVYCSKDPHLLRERSWSQWRESVTSGVMKSGVEKINKNMKRIIKKMNRFGTVALLMLILSSFLFPDPVAAANAWSIRQEINITDGYFVAPANTVATSSAIILYDSTKYSGTKTVYFEAVASTSASFTNTSTLRRKDTGTDDCTINIPGGTTSYTLIRSSACALPTGQTEYVARISSSASGTTGVKAVRLVVLQSFADDANSAATSTQTQIEIGNEETYSSTATSTFSSPKYWTYDSSKWDGTEYVFAEVTYAGTNSFASSTLYSTAGTYTVVIPSSVTSTWVQLWGAGGAGGPAAANPSGGSGGAGGQYASSTLTGLAGLNKTLVVAGSTAGCTSGTCATGASSTWDSTVVVAAGGTGGGQVTASTTGNTTGCVGDTCTAGGGGGRGTTTYGAGGGEGASPAGTGNSSTGAGVAGTGTAGGDGGAKNTTSKTDGNAGTAPGGGGGGAFRAGNGQTMTGGAGGAGQALIINNVTGSTTIAVQEDNGSFAGWTDIAYIAAGNAPASPARVRSTAFTPTNGRHYRIAFKSLDSRATFAIYNAKIIIDQQDTRSWAQSGNSLAVTGVTIPNMTALTSSRIVLAEDTNKQLRTYSWSGTDWSLVGNAFTVTTMSVPVMATLNSTDIAFVDFTNDQLRTYRFNGTDWSQVGNSLGISSTGSKYIAPLTSTDIAYVDNAFDTLQAYRFDGTNWATLGNSLGVACTGFPAMAKLSSTTVAVMCDMTLRTYGFDGSDWSQMGNTAIVTGTSGGAPAMYSLNASDVAFIDSTNDSLRTYRWDGTNWSNVGTNLTITGGNPAITALSLNTTVVIDDTNDSLRTYTDYNAGTSFSTIEPQYLLANTKVPSGTGLQNFLTKWDSSEWTGTTNTYLHAVDAADNSTSVVTLNTAAGTLLTNSTVTSPDNHATSTSAVTMPSNGNLDMKATTNNNDVYASRILVQASQTVATTATFSGTLYGTDESTVISTTPNVKMSVNGGTATTVAANGSGAFSFTGVTIPSAGDIITIWISGATEKGTLVFRYGSSCTGYNDCTGLSVYRDEVIVDSKDGSALTNTNMASCDNDTGTGCNTTDIGFTSNSGTLALASGRTLRLKDSSSIFSPGGDVSADVFKQSAGTFNGGSGTLAFAGIVQSSGTFNSTSGNLTLGQGLGADYTILDITGGTFNHNSGTVVFSGGTDFTFPNLTINLNTSLSLNNVTFNSFKSNNGQNFDINAGDTLVVLGTLTHTYGVIRSGTIELQGNMVVGAGTPTSYATTTLLVAGDQTITSGGGGTTKLDINKPSGTVSVTGDLTIQRFSLDGGTFTSTTGTLTVGANESSNVNTFSITGGTFNHNSGTIVFAGGQAFQSPNVTIDVNSSVTLNNVTFSTYTNNNTPYNIASGDNIIVLGTLTQNYGAINGSGTLEARGNVVIASTAWGGTAQISLTGAASQTITNSGGTAPTGMVTINKTNASDTVTLASNYTFTNGLVVTKGVFSQGASYNYTTASTTYIGTNGTWSNVGTGDIVLGGNVTNAGVITLNSSAGSQCTDSANDIAITSSSGGTQRTWSGAGTFTIYNVAVTDMIGALTVYNSAFTNSNWTNGVCTVAVSGTVYTDEGSTAMGSGRTVSIKVNGSGTYTTTTAANGTYTISGVVVNAGDTITAFLDGATEKAVTVSRSNQSNGTLTGFNLYQNYVIVRDEYASAISNSEFDLYDSGQDPDINFTVTAGALTVLNSNALYLLSGTFTPGGNVTITGSFKQVAGIFNGGSGAISLTGNIVLTGGTFNSTSGTLTIGDAGESGAWTNSGATFNNNNGTVTYKGRSVTWDVNTSETFYNLILCSRTCTGVDPSASLAVASGDTLIVTNLLTQTSGFISSGTIEVRGNMVLGSNAVSSNGTVSFLVSGDQTIDGNGGGTSNLYINKPSGTLSAGTTDLTISSLNLESGTFTTTSGILTLAVDGTEYGAWTHTLGGTFNHNNGTVTFKGRGYTWDVNGSETFYNLTFCNRGCGTTANSLTIASGDTLIVLNNFTHSAGDVNGGTVEVRGNVLVNSNANGGTYALTLTGSSAQTITNSGAVAPTGMVTINKTNASDTVTLASNYTFTNGLVVTKGIFSQGASYNYTTASTTYIGTNGTWSNVGTGDIVLGGNVTNAGVITLNSSAGSQCTDSANDIAITSSSGGTQRTWSGAGTFTLYNLAVTDMLGALTPYNSTMTNSNWSNAASCSNVTYGAGSGGVDGGSGGGSLVTGGSAGGGSSNGGGSGGGSALLTDLTEGGTITSTGTACNGGETDVNTYENTTTAKWCITGVPSTGSPISSMYDFSGATSYAVNKYTISTAGDAAQRDPKNWAFQGCQGTCTAGSDTGWVTLDTQTNQFASAARYETKTYTFTNTTAYQQFRVRFTANNGDVSNFQLSEIQLFVVVLGGGGGGAAP